MSNSNFNLAILDDAFPSLATGFRIAEFNWLIEHLNAQAFSANGLTYCLEKAPYAAYYPQYLPHIHHVKKILQNIYENIDLLYIVFMCNVKKFLPYIQKLNKPYIFSAYNSETLRTNTPVVDEDFSTFLNDPLCKGMIVAQKMWYDYILEKGFCSPDKIRFIYGGLSNVPSPTSSKKKYKQDKNTFDICFTAYLYGSSFIHSKGYDFFIEVARRLITQDPDFRFHVIGSATADTINISDIKDFITFHGKFTMNEFTNFYPGIDIMLSATRPTHKHINGVIQTTADGFPTISAVDAAKCGVFLMVTDLMANNIFFENDKNICIIPDDVDSVVQKIHFYKNNLDLFYQLSESCQKAFQIVFDIDLQMQQRVQFFEEALEG